MKTSLNIQTHPFHLVEPSPCHDLLKYFKLYYYLYETLTIILIEQLCCFFELCKNFFL